jgi:hypothetical protein
VTRFEVRFALRHPLRWLRCWWLHLAVTIMLVGLALTWTADVFAQVLQPNLWPLAAAAAGALCVASALAPYVRPVQALTGTALIALGLLRALAMVEVGIAATGENVVPLAIAYGIHALLLAALGVVWQDWTRACALRSTVEAGRDDRGRAGGG